MTVTTIAAHTAVAALLRRRAHTNEPPTASRPHGSYSGGARASTTASIKPLPELSLGAVGAVERRLSGVHPVVVVDRED